MIDQIFLPGQVITSHKLEDSARIGQGIYIREGSLHAAKVGRVVVRNDVVMIESKSSVPAAPIIGSIITGIVVKLSERDAQLSIIAVNGVPCRGDEGFAGLLRAQDVRQFEIDKVKMHDVTQTGDTIRARVISLGDLRSYYLTTADVELGVISAQSKGGNQMEVVSWTAMRDPITGAEELRKCAKPVV